ncbi:hypothetical protein AN641_05010 [Candidatus Epulonipiscioides gigas]|nr:hypothetical protein AN641_05010 [Epulopiscium sp. SCG-C07WGA-EpuloA2]
MKSRNLRKGFCLAIITSLLSTSYIFAKEKNTYTSDTPVEIKTLTQQNAPVITPNGNNLYFGQLHSHTTLSDGQGTIEEAYDYARNNAKLDFFAVTDHSDWFDNEMEADIIDGSMSTEWMLGLNTADKYNEDDIFTALYAFEMTWSSSTGKWGHINTFNTSGFETRNNKEMDLKTYYETLATQPDSISQLNHPGTTFGDFSDFGFYSAAADSVVTLIEVGNGEGPVRGSGYFPSYEYYTRALDKGWHIAPVNNQDNHKGKWGNSNTARTVIEAKNLSRDSVYDALREMRVYSTEDENLEISYQINEHTMGSILKDQNELNVEITAYDPDEDDEITKIELITDGGYSQFKTTNTNHWNLSINPEDVSSSTYFYVKVTQADGDIAVTAPIWVSEKENIGISSVEASVNKAIIGDSVTVDTIIYNNDKSNIEDIEVEYWINGKTISTQKVDNIAPSEQNVASADIVIEKNGTNIITAIVRTTINGHIREFSQNIEVSGVKEAETNRILIDGSKNNAYVTGGYIDNMNFVTELIQDNGGVVKINQEQLTDELLSNIDLLIITDAESKEPASHYSDSEIEAIKNYINKGGNLILTSKADYGDVEGEHGNATQANTILHSIGATVRFNDDQLIDNIENGGQSYRLYFDNYNENSKYTENSQGNFSFYSGSSILIDDKTTTEYIIKGHSTSESSDADKQNDAKKVNKGDTIALAVETLPSGAKVVVSGVTFFSDFEMEPSNEYSNHIIMENILHDLAPEKDKTITPISQIHTDANNDNAPDLKGEIHTVKGTVTSGNSVSNNTFVGVVYVQDETGGLAIYPVSNVKLEVGQKVQITGVVGAYQGDTQLSDVIETTDVKILDTTIKEVAPTKMSTQNTMLESNEGLLIATQGTITKIGDVSSGNIWIDDGSGEARIYIDGYIGSGKSGKSDNIFSKIKLGDTINVIGLSSENSDGNRIRIRNTDDIIIIK